MKVFIATPTIASTMQVETTLSIVNMVNELRDGGMARIGSIMMAPM